MVAPYRRPVSARQGDRDVGFPWLVKAMLAVIVIGAFVALLVVWSQSGAPSQLQTDHADSTGPRPQDGVTTLSE